MIYPTAHFPSISANPHLSLQVLCNSSPPRGTSGHSSLSINTAFPHTRVPSLWQRHWQGDTCLREGQICCGGTPPGLPASAHNTSDLMAQHPAWVIIPARWRPRLHNGASAISTGDPWGAVATAENKQLSETNYKLLPVCIAQLWGDRSDLAVLAWGDFVSVNHV